MYRFCWESVTTGSAKKMIIKLVNRVKLMPIQNVRVKNHFQKNSVTVSVKIQYTIV